MEGIVLEGILLVGKEYGYRLGGTLKVPFSGKECAFGFVPFSGKECAFCFVPFSGKECAFEIEVYINHIKC